ncbi:MAG: hypothetical protein OEM15_09865 [Myxococcales bacterium]|nr:hypothetical protein [Myxococcales bacterium]MDH3485682.1 hypothetical protein [Myxococcales bacterium]
MILAYRSTERGENARREILGTPYGVTGDGFEAQMGTNHLGHFALTGRLLSALKRTAGSRVVTVSSSAHRTGTMSFDNLLFRDGRGYTPRRAYSRSKLANRLFAYELQRRFERHRIVDRSSRPSVAPGVFVADKAAGYCRVGLRTFEPVVTTNALS